MRVLIVGTGYVGLPLGAELARQGHEVFGLRRNRAAEGELNAVGIKPLFADITRADELARLPREFDWVVNCAASGGGDAEEYRQIYLEGMRNLIEWLAPNRQAGVPRFVYTSSTSVYGQNDGSIVNEQSPAEPAMETARVLLEAEKVLLEGARDRNFPAMILRVAGIYGPERGHWFKQFLKGEARLNGSGERFLNMIHRDDVIGGVIAVLERGRPGDIYNAVDDEPVSQRDFFSWLAAATSLPMPAGAPTTPEARKRGVTNKRVSNRKLKADLGYSFKFPTFREGYAEPIRKLENGGKEASRTRAAGNL
ncbi:MAG TPA: SDR family oxidoreductase [Verrucomicrobiae bacterium]|jgi:nucleoside-diphosphate-sugar epimerase|nr:SDR family oxidoreductase [Verrucomicrobiae bacterium]